MYSLPLFVFLNHGFKFQCNVFNVCLTIVMFFMIWRCVISDIAIITVSWVDYCCIIHGISKCDTIHLLENSVFDDRGYI